VRAQRPGEHPRVREGREDAGQGHDPHRGARIRRRGRGKRRVAARIRRVAIAAVR
jgi:hypothetical protein